MRYLLLAIYGRRWAAMRKHDREVVWKTIKSGNDIDRARHLMFDYVMQRRAWTIYYQDALWGAINELS